MLFWRGRNDESTDGGEAFVAMSPPGAGPSSPAQVQSLQTAINGASPPHNPNHPTERVDPQNRTLLDMQRIRKSLERALEPYDGGPPDAMTDIYKMMHGVVSRMLAGIDPVQAMLVGVQTLIPSPMPMGGTQGIAAPQASAGPPPPANLLAGMQGPVPVSPGPGGAPGAPAGGPPG
jgi:hypothetical protein